VQRGLSECADHVETDPRRKEPADSSGFFHALGGLEPPPPVRATRPSTRFA
jgi:hypothetical protein